MSRDVSWDENWGNGGAPYQNDIIDQRDDNGPVFSKSNYRQHMYNRQQHGDWGDNGGQGYDTNLRPPFDQTEYQQQYREDFPQESSGVFDETQRQWEHQRYGENYGPQEQYIDGPENYYDEQKNPFVQRGDFSGDSYQGGIYYYDSPPLQRFPDDNYVDQSRPGEYDRDRIAGFGGSQQQQYDTRSYSDQETKKQYRPSMMPSQQYASMQGQSGMHEPFGFGAFERMRGGMMNPFAGLGMMDRMMDEMVTSFEMMDQMMGEMTSSFEMMDRFSHEVGANIMNENLMLDDARDYILADPAVTNILGDGIQMGAPFARSSSSVIINGENRSRFQLDFPIRGSLGEGHGRVLADEEEITQLGVDVGDRIIEVSVGEQRSYNSREDGGSDVIDADVVDKEVY